MLRAPAVKARRKIREMCGSQAVLVAGSSRDENEPDGHEEPTEEPPAKKTCLDPDLDKTKPEVEPAHKKSKKRTSSPNEDEKELSAKKAKHDIPRKDTRYFFRKKFKRRLEHGSSSKEGAASSGDDAGDSSQSESVMGDAYNNNEATERSNKPRRQKKRHAKADNDDEPTKKVQRLAEQVENSTDEGVGSLVDSLDDMSVNDKPKSNPTATVPCGSIDHKQVAQRDRSHWEKNLEQISAISALRAAVVADEISVSMFLHIESNLKKFFADCGSITQFGVPQFAATGPVFSIKVHFETENAAAKALEKDGARFGAAPIRVRRPGPQERASAASGYSNLMPRVGEAFMSSTRARSISPDFECHDPSPAPREPEPAVHRGRRRTRGNPEIDLSSDSD